MGCKNCNNNDILSEYSKGIGDWFISDEQKRLNESYLKDAEIQRMQTEEMIDYLSKKKAMSSTGSKPDQQTLLILGGLGVITVFAIIMLT